MGRTNPTYRDTLRRTEERWAAYRRALRRRDRAHFDRLFEHARAHADAAGYLNHPTAEVPLLVSVLLAHERRLARLEAARGDAEGDGGSESGSGSESESEDGAN